MFQWPLKDLLFENFSTDKVCNFPKLTFWEKIVFKIICNIFIGVLQTIDKLLQLEPSYLWTVVAPLTADVTIGSGYQKIITP